MPTAWGQHGAGTCHFSTYCSSVVSNLRYTMLVGSPRSRSPDMKYSIVNHDTMGRAISPGEVGSWSKPKTPHCRYLQRPCLTTDSAMSYRNDHPGTVDMHQDKDLRRGMAIGRCQNDIKSRWDKDLERATQNNNGGFGPSRAAFTGKSRDSMGGKHPKRSAKGSNNGPIRADKSTVTPAAAGLSGPRSNRTSHARRRPAASRTSRGTGPARAWSRHSTAGLAG